MTDQISPKPWTLADCSLTVLYGCREIAKLSHYFLPKILLNHRRVLYLDGANQVSPLLLARFARDRKIDPSELNSMMRVARAFTCFQLTEMIRRIPTYLKDFPANVVIVTALPDLYFDEDAKDREATASYCHALEGLGQLENLPVSVAVFTDATSFKTKRRDFFTKLRNQANQVIRVENTSDNKLSFTNETPSLLSA